MSTPLEDYALLSDLRTGPLVSRDGSVDWLCLPRFDSAAVFCAILGGPDDGRWKVSAVDGEVVERRYLPQTFVLETTWRTPTGAVRVTDFLPPGTGRDDLVRRVECLEGTVEVEHDLRLRFDYARATPWVRVVEHHGSPALLSLAGPDGLLVTGPLLTWAGTHGDGKAEAGHGAAEQPGAFGSAQDGQGGEGGEGAGARAPRLTGTFRLEQGDVLDWDLAWFPSWADLPDPVDADHALAETMEYWADWSSRLTVHADHTPVVLRSLLVLRALTHEETGGIVAAPTASLPEGLGGERNWDYRYVWLRDAALTIEVAIAHGLTGGARLWRDWLLRAVAGDAHDIKIMYGVGGERELDEKELGHLAGYEESRPVRIGNGAADQYQADVVGEVMIALAMLRDAGVADDEYSWGLQKSLLEFCEANYDREDHGIWEMRGDLHHFTHGRAMMWAAFDRGVRAVEDHGLDGPVDRWRELRDRLREEVLERGFDTGVDSFTQTYDNTEVDASLLQLPHTGLVAYDDPRMLGTVARIESELRDEHGLLHRYRTDTGMDGLEGEEHPFLICCFWLVEQYAMSGRLDDAQALMDQLVGYANDVGLLSEEYDPQAGRLIGNFPQAFSHLGLIRAADALAAARGRAGSPG
ncbi:glycoside hydrolase 15-related protein [Cellulomonas flavigena DSM 20109]|uniref:Glycoside hydrolase 15-related protein n=1 Tax=Cellulomonas flavigena (strain ATCC 482 / DSM 20109 / BCRC 11376 / JCM 18109 / NBRC 3775 / NCIMB 8073 / NRS 134) TaxID=446466 RepID=D5UH89_CELFN|nr:glycoside hydrolase family 15 protein [Cellulomonas flavigena]ADG73292.1 glycoside hydrolase 15-related protein [Cellulomonas flavigena DSM 20109]